MLFEHLTSRLRNQRMLSSGSFEFQQQHIDIVQEDARLRELLLRSAAEMKHISVSRSRCPHLDGRAFIIQWSGRFTDAGYAFTPTGKINKLSEYNMLRLSSFLEVGEMHVWPALSHTLTFGLCDTSQFA